MSAAKKQIIFILWGEHFDELTAVTFITQLRKAGLSVKVVGVSRKPAVGAHGLYLLHDLTLEEALTPARQVCAVVIPCGNRGIQPLVDDPRIHQLLQQLCAHQALLFSTPLGIETLATFNGLAGTCVVMSIPPAEGLVNFVEEVGRQLLARGM